MATRAALVGLAAILWMACTLAAMADTLSGRVVDGDTLVVLISVPGAQKRQEKVRLVGIDAPESRQPWGQKAKQSLSGYVFGRDVTVEWSKRDRYGRIVGKVLDGERDVNLAMVRDGMAWWYRKYAGEQSPVDRTLYEAAEIKARAARRGSGQTPIPSRLGISGLAKSGLSRPLLHRADVRARAPSCTLGREGGNTA